MKTAVNSPYSAKSGRYPEHSSLQRFSFQHFSSTHTPISPPSGPSQWLFQEPPAEGKFLAADRAAPSMQLAVLSMLAGEKLKGGPLADAIDFKNFSQAQATAKQAYGQDTRVSEMLRMVNALK